jgi:hypothetical protein
MITIILLMIGSGMLGCTAGVLTLAACRVAATADEESYQILEHRIRTALERHPAE